MSLTSMSSVLKSVLTLTLLVGAVTGGRVVRETTDQAATTRNTLDGSAAPDITAEDLSVLMDGEPLLDASQLGDLDVKQFLEIGFINRSVSDYQDKLRRTQVSLQGRVKDFIASVRGGGGADQQPMYSPEFREKMNATFWEFVSELELSPYCLYSLKHIKDELMNKKFWPLRCK